MVAGWLISVSTPPRLSASAINCTEFEERPRLVERTEIERDHAAEAAHLPFGQFVMRVIGQPGVVHLRDLRMAGQERRERHAVLVVPLHPDRQRLGAAQNQPGVHRAEDRAFGILHEPQPLDVIVAYRHRHAADAVAVAVEKLGGAMDDDVGAEFDGALNVRAGERVVDDHKHAVRVRDVTRRRASPLYAARDWSASRGTASSSPDGWPARSARGLTCRRT